MSLHLQKFIDRMRGNEHRNNKDFVMPMSDAKGMLADLTELLLELNHLKTASSSALTNSSDEINISGGNFK